jgi:hypothetical protein
MENGVENRVEEESKGADHDCDFKSHYDVGYNPSSEEHFLEPVFPGILIHNLSSNISKCKFQQPFVLLGAVTLCIIRQSVGGVPCISMAISKASGCCGKPVGLRVYHLRLTS